MALAYEESPEFTVKESLLFAGVCSSLPQEEVERRMRARPCGTRNGWMLDEEPVACEQKPETHKHYKFVC